MQIDYYALAEAHGRQIFTLHLQETDAMSVELDNRCYIALSQDQTQAEMRSSLAHEMGHCEYGGFYNYHSPYEIRSRTENRANRWAYLTAVPLDEIESAIHGGCREIWELADYFNVTPKFMQDALRFYVDQLGVHIKE